MGELMDILYKEASNSVRHYSGAIFMLKSITIAQGFALLAAQGFLYKSQDTILSLGLAFFGLFFTLALYLIGSNLMGHFNAVLGAAQAIEKKLCPDQNDLAPWSALEKSSIRKAGNPFVRAMTLHGHVILLLVAFFSLILYDVFTLLR